MVLKSYTNFSDAQLIEHLNGDVYYQLFCGVQIDPLHPLTNPKIVSAIRQELADRLDVESLQLRLLPSIGHLILRTFMSVFDRCHLL